MARRKRNHKREYARRKELAAERGLSLSQARGHPKAGERSVRSLKKAGVVGSGREGTLDRFYRAVNRMRRGEPLTKAARAEHISPKTVKRLNEERHLFGKTYSTGKGGRSVFSGWSIGEVPHFPLLTRDGHYLPSVPFDQKNASVMGRYWNAVDKALKGNDNDLRGFSSVTVYDANGNRYRLLTNINAIRAQFDAMSDEEQEEFDRAFYLRREVQRVA